MTPPPAPPRAFALVITLAFVVLITLIIVGFALSMRLDRPAASLHLEKTRARFLAGIATDHAAATLLLATADPERNWISQPGQLVFGAAEAGPGPADQRKILQETLPLHSGGASAPAHPGILSPPDLNVASLRDAGNHLITEQKADPADPGAMPLRVAWVYLRKDGSLDRSPSPDLTNAANPIMGRYAYWTDDESSKVNYNLAWGRSGANPNPPGHPSRIRLDALEGLSEGMADAIHAFITADPGYASLNHGFFNTPDDVRRVEMEPGGAGGSEVIRANRFDLTHYNHDPDTTFFGEPRIVLTTSPARAGWKFENGQWIGKNGLPGAAGRPAYIRILTDAQEGPTPGDPGPYANLDSAKLTGTINRIVSYLQRSDWPMVTGDGSLQDKYFSAYPEATRATRLAQIAINIIDYVRCKEAAPNAAWQNIVQPLRLVSNGGTPPVFTKSEAPTNYSLSFFGQTRGPLINEVGVWLSDDLLTMKIRVELYLPRNYGLEQVDLTKLYLSTESGVHGFGIQSNPPPIPPGSISHPILTKGGYSTVTYTRTHSSGTTTLTSRPLSATLRVAIAQAATTSRIDVSSAFSAYRLECPVDPEGVPPEAITSLEVDDPRVNKHPGDWKQRAGGNSFGAPNSLSVLGVARTADPSIVPQQDADATGMISTASFYMPPPAGTVFTRSDGSVDDNTSGMVGSSGELGYIHTGIECSPKTPAASPPQLDLPPGTPWRTLRLQPNRQPVSVVPDWAFMDLFAAPLEVHENARYVYHPRGTEIGGRVNINGGSEPFALERIHPLMAVLKGCRDDSTNAASRVGGAKAQAIARNIRDRTLATGAAEGKEYGYGAGFDSVGEIVEIRGVADEGEKSEELFRDISNLITTRGNVFSVYAIGQALIQTPSGELKINAEERTRTIVERYFDAASGATRLAPVFTRSLSP